MPKGGKEEMQGTMATFDPAASQDNNREQDLESLISGLMQEVSFLREEVDRQSSLTPRWMTSDEMDGLEQESLDYDPANIMANLKGEEDGLAGQMFFGTDSHAIPPNLLRRYGPKFKINQRVQINPDTIVHGHSSTTWGSVLAQEGSKGRGIVKKVIHLTDAGEWKYQVRVPGLTTKQGSGFLESELLPIRQKVTKYVVEEQ